MNYEYLTEIDQSYEWVILFPILTTKKDSAIK
jgi:hypothetical protein